MIKNLSIEEIASLYKNRIRADFPRRERRPLFLIRKLYAEGRYACLALEEGGDIAAYATFLCDGEVSGVLLDYFAVDERLRGNGVGSRFFAMLPAHWQEKGGILLECERPGAAKNEAEKKNRERRIAFYRRGGAQEVALRWRAFGVDYNVLWRPICTPAAQADAAGDLVALYTLSMPAALARLFMKAHIASPSRNGGGA